MADESGPKFHPGRLMATPAALAAIEAAGQGADEFVGRHLRGDWGEVGGEDRRLNDEALSDGSRLLSAFTTAGGVRLWIITEAADEGGIRAATTILLPNEY